MDILPVTCRLTTPGGWLVVSEGLYRLSATAFGEQSTTFRRSDVSNPFVEGSWTVNATRENVTETLDVYVRADTAPDVQRAVSSLLATLRQINFGMEVTFDGVQTFYQCYCADVSVKTPREFRFSRMAQVSAQIPRHPGAEWKAV
jgi:hypothetical protein